MVTLRDLAKHAGVSVSTASYSMNGNPLIKEETRNKVLKAAKEIGYRPNGMAKNLKEQKTNIIGLFLSGFTGPFFNDMLEGVQDVVIENGFELVVCATVDKHRLLVEGYVDAAIILNYHVEDELLDSLANKKLPIIVLDRELQNPYIKNVLIPNEEGSAMVVKYLLEKGHKRLGYIAGSDVSYDGEKRLKGFRMVLDQLGVEFSDRDLMRADFTEISGYLEMSKYLDSFDSDIPTAIVCANDEMALGAIRAIQEKDLRVPDDIAVVGFDDIYQSAVFTPSLTTIRIPRRQWGITAAQTLFKMLDQDFDYQPASLKVELISRTSG